MKQSITKRRPRSRRVVLGVLALVVLVLAASQMFRSEAVVSTGNDGKSEARGTRAAGLENYDIRTDKAGYEKIDAFRASINKDAVAVANIRENFVLGEDALRARIPNVKVEYNSDIHTPEVITPDVWKAKIEWLTSPSSVKHSEILRSFIKENNALVGVDDAQANNLKVTADYTNPDDNLSYAHLQQFINNIPVFRGEVKAGFTKDGRIIRVINNVAPGLDYGSLSTDFRNPADAVRAAAGFSNYELQASDKIRNDAESNELKTVYGSGDWATTAEKMYFPTEPGVAVPAWRVLIWQPVDTYYVIVDAVNGTMLWRKNVTEDQTQSATYQVYRNPNGYIDAADSPAPLSPGPIDPTLGTQAPVISRTNMTLIGNEGSLSFNNNGWITDGANITDGNALEAGVDRVAPNGVDAPQTGIPNRVFDSTWNPAPGNPAPGDDPLTAQAQRGAVIQMFYVMNRYHDELYKRGFTEPAFNFQHDNFGRGGVANDRISAEGQDSSGTNNANFATLADGNRGRMQMYLWTGPTPDYDGTGDAEVIIHEVTHGTSNRLHGNASGLSTNMSRGMGEGWGDFFGYTMLAEPGDNVNGIYTTGGYATYLIAAGFAGNYYYGIRRFPRAPITFLGANGKPHNPFTFQYINSNCNTLIGTTATNPNSAFPRGPVGSATCDQVHNIGEIWSSMLWEVRTRMVTRLGFASGTTKVLQVVTDGMKMAPIGPTILQERDSIIAAAAASPLSPETSADVADVREGFRVRGAGFSASIQNAGTGANNTAVTEAYDLPNAIISAPLSVSDSSGDNDGFPEPTENVLISVPITNSSGTLVTNVVGSITGGGSANYGDIADGQTVTRQIPYTIPGAAICGANHTVNITGTSSVGALTPQTFTFRLGVPVGGAPVSFTNSTPVDIPMGQPTTTSGPASPYPSNIAVSGLTGNKIMKVTFNGFHHEFEDDIDMLLVGPGGQKFIFLSDVGGTTELFTPITFSVTDSAATLLPDATAITPGGTFKPSNPGANDAFVAPAPAGPYMNAAPGGTDTFTSVFGTSAAALNGTWSLFIVDDAGADPGRLDGGWTLTFEANDFTCQVTGDKPVADFDGDNKTDLSVFRAGTWFLQRSTAGFLGIGFGLPSDTIVPGDYDGDGKADIAVFRTNTWYIMKSSDGTVLTVPWGASGDIPRAANYDGDSKTDVAVYRPSTNTYFVLRSSDSTVAAQNWGTAGDIPVVADFDGDHKADYGVFRSGTWHILGSTAGYTATPFGLAGDKLVPADYDNDGKADIAVFRGGTWYLNRSTAGYTSVPWGLGTDIPVPGDYDGDGKDDVAVFRGSTGTWYIVNSGGGTTTTPFGTSGDVAVPAGYIP